MFISHESPPQAGALPLQMAVSRGHTELVRLLLDAGASPHIPGLVRVGAARLRCSALVGWGGRLTVSVAVRAE
mgnify:CR=1 FL=1